MAILGLQGVRGGVGTTSIASALAWSLQVLGESVLVVDACPDNLLRMSFNVDFTRTEGWARAMLDGHDWQDAGLRYTSQLDVLPFGQLSTGEQESLYSLPLSPEAIAQMATALAQAGHYQWIIIDLPHTVTSFSRPLIAACDNLLAVVNVDANCHIRLHQQTLPASAYLLINDLRIGSQIQDDLHQLWIQSHRRLLPMVIHRDEALSECLAAKQPLGEYRGDSLAAQEILTLANWCLLHCAGGNVPAGSSP